MTEQEAIEWEVPYEVMEVLNEQAKDAWRTPWPHPNCPTVFSLVESLKNVAANRADEIVRLKLELNKYRNQARGPA